MSFQNVILILNVHKIDNHFKWDNLKFFMNICVVNSVISWSDFVKLMHAISWLQKLFNTLICLMT